MREKEPFDENIEETVEYLKSLPQADSAPIPDADIGEWKPAFEPAKEGEELPKEIWIPNRRERRLMKKRGNKMEKFLSKFYQNAINEARDYVNTPNYKNEIYKALYEKTKARNEELEKEIAENGITANEGN